MPGTIHGGDTGDIACDHYRRAADDVALMRNLGLTAYRLSIAWGRILPTGRGRANRPGLAFYERLVDALLASNIQPMITLYHWDLPAALDDLGGWLNPDSAAGSRNTPTWSCARSMTGYALGDDQRTLGHRRRRLYARCARAWARSAAEAGRVSHNLLRAHAAAVDAYRASGRHEIGLSVNLEPQMPASADAADLDAADRAGAYFNRQYLDPVFLGISPRRCAPSTATDRPACARRTWRWSGVPWTSSASTITRDPSCARTRARSPLGRRGWHRRRARTPTWAGRSTPPDSPRFCGGCASATGQFPCTSPRTVRHFREPASSDGTPLQDHERVAYLRSHIQAAHAAMVAAGVDLRGYFAWSLLDNFEWNYGYAKRFGLIHVDYRTQRRTIKESGAFYRRFIGGPKGRDDRTEANHGTDVTTEPT